MGKKKLSSLQKQMIDLIDSLGDIGVNYADREGNSFLSLASEAGSDVAVERLLFCGANPNQSNRFDDTALHKAAENGHVNIIKLLIEYGATLDVADRDNNSPLHLALKYGHIEAAKLLIKSGIDIVTPNNEGETPLYLAFCQGYYDISLLLEGYGAVTNDGGRAIMKIVKDLLVINEQPLTSNESIAVKLGGESLAIDLDSF